jgi:hypothetical protein
VQCKDSHAWQNGHQLNGSVRRRRKGNVFLFPSFLTIVNGVRIHYYKGGECFLKNRGGVSDI